MKSIRILIAAVIALLGVTAIAQATAAVDSPSTNPNEPAYWQLRTEHPSICYKHGSNDTNNVHGRLSADRTAVILNPYQQSWPGDHWELLVVKSGSVDVGNGPGNAVYHHPVAGTPYTGPLNSAGAQGTVSHWIVCKGTTPAQPVPTSVSWVATDGDCDAPSGTLAVTYDAAKVTYVGDAPGPYGAGATVTGQFTAKPGYVITGNAGPFTHTFEVDGAPCEQPSDLRLVLTPECAVGDTVYWRVTNVHDVDIPFTFDGPGASDGDGIAPAGGTTIFTTANADGADPTSIAWTNPSGGPSAASSDRAVESCVYHVSFEKVWQGADAPDLDGAVLLSATSSLGSATCTSDDGALTCVYELGGAPADDLAVPFGETYSVSEQLPGGWHVVSGTGDGFTGIAGFDDAALPGSLVLDVDDARSCTPNQSEDDCTHTVTNAPSGQAPAPLFVDPTCADRDVAVVDPNPDDDITYEVVAGTVAAGETVTVRAVAGPGTVLTGQTEWDHEFGEIGDTDCVVPGTPSSSVDAECGAATLTFTNTIGELPDGYTGGPVEFTYTVDGEAFTVTVDAGETEVVELDFAEDSGVHTVVIGDGNPVLVESNCELDEVTPVAPTFVDPTCDEPDSAAITLPSVDGVVYAVDGTPGSGATVTVTATAEPGHVLTGTATWTHTFSEVGDDVCAPPEPTIDVAAFSPVCQADIPYIEYAIEVSGTDADEATLTFIDDTDTEILTLTGMPLSGRIIYPGAAENPNPDWPGWRLNAAGLWVPDPTDANWRDGLTVRVEVNPTATTSVAYPPATSVCAGPEIVQSGGPTTTTTTTTVASAAPTTTVASRLPRTGSSGVAPLLGLGAALLALGLVLATAVRRPRPS